VSDRVPCVRQRADGRWFFRKRITLPDGTKRRIFGTPAAWGLPNTEAGAIKAMSLAVEGEPERVVRLAPWVPRQRRYQDAEVARITAEVAARAAELDAGCGHGAGLGYVYVVAQQGCGLLKIGKAADPVARVADLQAMNGAPLSLVGLCHDARVERVLHDRFGRERVRGEWVRLDASPVGLSSPCWSCARASLKSGRLVPTGATPPDRADDPAGAHLESDRGSGAAAGTSEA
jgi:hypothetical protein